MLAATAIRSSFSHPVNYFDLQNETHRTLRQFYTSPDEHRTNAFISIQLRMQTSYLLYFLFVSFSIRVVFYQFIVLLEEVAAFFIYGFLPNNETFEQILPLGEYKRELRGYIKNSLSRRISQHRSNRRRISIPPGPSEIFVYFRNLIRIRSRSGITKSLKFNKIPRIQLPILLFSCDSFNFSP